MFSTAVARLTLWYVLVIVLLSLVFSVALYNVSTKELNALQKRQESILELPLLPKFTELNQSRLREVEESKRNIALDLVWLNILIWAAGGAVSYFLAKRTLQPIEDSLEAQNRFTADASHELRTPLTAMRAEIEVALRGDKLTVAESKELLRSNLEEIQRLESLSHNLLKLASQPHSSEDSKEATSLQEIVEKAQLNMERAAKQRGITVVLDVREGTLRVDSWGIAEVVAILLDNAIKYSPEGGAVHVRAYISHGQAQIHVKDEGMGIKASDLPHVFDRFYRADLSRSKQKVEGYGLGLSIAKKIVEMHRGTIEVKSILGKGSLFTVRLPVE